MPRLKEVYKNIIFKKIVKGNYFKNVMEIPSIKKIVLNVGIGKEALDKKVLEDSIYNLMQISGQKPMITKAKKSIEGFKIRKGWPIGCVVTLRGSRMYEFLDRLLSIVIPNVRDFRGFSSKSFDGNGNYNLGIKEQMVFPEIDYHKTDSSKGLNITIVTNANNNTDGLLLLKLFKFPFKVK